VYRQRDPELRVTWVYGQQAHLARGIGNCGLQVVVELSVGCPSFTILFQG
jgi:hypothetical protein